MSGMGGDGGGDGARRLGERLLGDIRVEGLNEILSSLRELAIPPGEKKKVFGIPELDALLPSATSIAAPSQQAQHHQQPQDNELWDPIPQPRQPIPEPLPTLTTSEKKPSIHILELVSPPYTHHPSGAGKTSLIHLITTLAILPPSLSSIPLNGANGAIILFDPLSHFSVPRLAEIMLSHITTAFREAGKNVHDEKSKKEILDCVETNLSHVHIFRPTTWQTLLATLHSLQPYLFDASRHYSINRHVHSIILEDVDFFTSELRATSTSSTSTAISLSNNPLRTASTHLTTPLLALATLLSTNLILTTRSTTPSSFRPALPTSWPLTTTTHSTIQPQITRLAIRRVEVLKFAPGLSIEEAEAERKQRWEVVSRGRFEAWRVGRGAGGAEREGEGFVFRVGSDGGGVVVERREG